MSLTLPLITRCGQKWSNLWPTWTYALLASSPPKLWYEEHFSRPTKGEENISECTTEAEVEKGKEAKEKVGQAKVGLQDNPLDLWSYLNCCNGSCPFCYFVNMFWTSTCTIRIYSFFFPVRLYFLFALVYFYFSSTFECFFVPLNV